MIPVFAAVVEGSCLDTRLARGQSCDQSFWQWISCRPFSEPRNSRMVQPENRVECGHVDDAHITEIRPSYCSMDLVMHTLQRIIRTRPSSSDPSFVAHVHVVGIGRE